MKIWANYSAVCRPGSGWAAFFVGTRALSVESQRILYDVVWGLVILLLGAGVLFSTAAVMALANSAFALTVPKPARKEPPSRA